MLFAVLYTARDATEEKDKRSLNLFTNWKPPAGYEFKAHYALADGAVNQSRLSIASGSIAAARCAGRYEATATTVTMRTSTVA